MKKIFYYTQGFRILYPSSHSHTALSPLSQRSRTSKPPFINFSLWYHST